MPGAMPRPSWSSSRAGTVVDDVIKKPYSGLMAEKTIWVDLYAGRKGWTEVAEERGDEVLSIDNDKQFDVTWQRDMMTVSHQEILEHFGGRRPHIVVASPPCTAYSTGSFRHHWKATTSCRRCGTSLIRVSGEKWLHEDLDFAGCLPSPLGKPNLVPKSETGRIGYALLRKTLSLIGGIGPRYFIIENPRAAMRRMPDLAGLERRTTAWCQWGLPIMKPTDLWGIFPEKLEIKPPCNSRNAPVVPHKGKLYRVDKNTGEPCHEYAPRGSRDGAQGFDKVTVAKIPRDLSQAVYEAVHA